MRITIAALAVAFLLVAVVDSDVSAKGKPAGAGQKGGPQKGGQHTKQQQAQFHLLITQLQHAFHQGNPAQIQAAQLALQTFLAQAQQQGMNQHGKGKGKGKD